MKALRNMSIKHKLIALILVVTGIVLLLTSIAFVSFDRINYKHEIVRFIDNIAGVIAINSSAAITFNNPTDAQEILASLATLPFIITTTVYTNDGSVLASYVKDDSLSSYQPPPIGDTGLVMHRNSLTYARYIDFDGENIGMVRIEASLYGLQDRLNRYVGIVAVFALTALVIAFGMATRLQRVISEPILHLTRLARTVTEKEDYTVRAEKTGNDETGYLIDSFNDMLANIQYRDDALQKAHDKLTEWTQQLQVELVERKRVEDRITKSLREKEVLLKEIHHRVKNNLQVISSLLNLQSRCILDPKALEMFTESQHRVRSMALIHEKLYQSQDLSLIDFSEYTRNLTTYLTRSYAVDSGRINLHVDVKDIYLGIDTAVPCGLILNELVSNSLKHAFATGEKGEIAIKLRHKENGTMQLTVSDNGRGMPENLDFHNTESLGMQLVTTLTSQLKGTIVLDRSGGTTFRLTFEV
ncbi:MAG: HAMP domain-containing protein [candidate division Zixibacteria bacterium]|nr:HAMP domain-containing protein [candidate division Zixibacteria bacterium]